MPNKSTIGNNVGRLSRQRVHRRDILIGATALLATTIQATPAFAQNSAGEDNMKRIDSGKSFVRYALGDIQVISLRDGYVDMPVTRLREPGNKTFGNDLPQQVKLVGGKFRLSVNAFLIVDGKQSVLIDTGAADSWEPSMGELLQGLAEAGIDRASVETVALTHTHEDHAHGLVAAGGGDAFPNLKRLYVPANEIPLFDKIDRVARFRDLRLPVEEGFQVTPNVKAISANGHEVGHTVYEVKGAGATLLVWGDIVHVPSIQFQRPELTWELDADQEKARASRLRILKQAAEPHVYVAGAHLDSPGVGKVTQDGKSYAFSPL
jgi:glyoxylase-like metal-dependent hydrolase (beta-lactamase superfamily II)